MAGYFDKMLEPRKMPPKAHPPHIAIEPLLPPGAVPLNSMVSSEGIIIGYRTAGGTMETRCFSLISTTRWPD